MSRLGFGAGGWSAAPPEAVEAWKGSYKERAESGVLAPPPLTEMVGAAGEVVGKAVQAAAVLAQKAVSGLTRGLFSGFPWILVLVAVVLFFMLTRGRKWLKR